MSQKYTYRDEFLNGEIGVNIAIVLAAGVGQRMRNGGLPKQFLKLMGKPIIIYTLEKFEASKEIDKIIVVSHGSYVEHMQKLIGLYQIHKVSKVIVGGSDRQSSLKKGLDAVIEENGQMEDIVLIHDGVRPLITAQTITDNIKSVKKFGSAITCANVTETVILVGEKDNTVQQVPSREHSRLAKAPQSFWLKDILEVDRRAIADGKVNMIDSCTMMRIYGYELAVVIGSNENIKITTPDDFYIFRALYDARENQQLD